jgi:uncharacterized protein
MSIDPFMFLVAGIAVICLGLSKGGFIGFGLIATPLLALAIPPLQAAAVLLPVMLAQDLFSAWSFRSEWDRRTLSLVLPGAVFGIALAWALARYLDQASVRIVVGTIGIAFAISHWVGFRSKAEGGASGLFWGTAAGFTGTIANAGGPPFLVYAMSFHFSRLGNSRTTACRFLRRSCHSRSQPILSPFGSSGEYLPPHSIACPIASCRRFRSH